MITIIIVTYNSEKCIARCIESIYQNTSNLSEITILIVDNNSTDNTLSVVSRCDQTNTHIIKNNKNTGFAQGVNQGIRYALDKFSPQYFLLLNPDAWLEKNCLSLLKKELASDPKIALTSPRIIDPRSKSVWFEGGHINWLRIKNFHTKNYFDNFFYTPYLTGCALFIRTEITQKIGLLDESFFLYYEDADYSLRAQKSGFKITIMNEAVCWHQESQSSDSETKLFHLVASGYYFFWLHCPLWLKPWFWSNFILRFAYHTLITRKKTVLRGMRSFLKKIQPKIKWL
jgi:GT2 family glycosyltransferase